MMREEMPDDGAKEQKQLFEEGQPEPIVRRLALADKSFIQGQTFFFYGVEGGYSCLGCLFIFSVCNFTCIGMMDDTFAFLIPRMWAPYFLSLTCWTGIPSSLVMVSFGLGRYLSMSICFPLILIVQPVCWPFSFPLQISLNY